MALRTDLQNVESTVLPDTSFRYSGLVFTGRVRPCAGAGLKKIGNQPIGEVVPSQRRDELEFRTITQGR